jgi:hypothetical protein
MPRLRVTALIVVGMSAESARRAMLGRGRSPVRATRGSLRDGEATVHRARVQLCRLGQTYGEPGRKHTGQKAGHPITTHGSNISRGRA